MKIAELFAEVGFKFDSLKLKELSSLISNLNVSSMVSTASLGKLAAEIGKTMEAASKTSIAMLQLKEATGLDPLRLQQLDVYFQQFGAQAGEAQSALYNLNKLRLSVLQGNGNPQPFILTGLSPTTDTLKLLDQIHERFSDPTFLQNWAKSFATSAKSLEEMRAAWKDMIANQFGIPTSMLRGLDQSNEKWKEQLKILGLIDSDLQKGADLHAAWVMAAHDLSISFQKLSLDLAPIVIALANLLDKTVRLIDTIGTKTGAFEKIADVLDVPRTGGQTLKDIIGLSNAPSRFIINELNKMRIRNTGNSGNQTNNINLHINSNTPEEFIKRFDEVWKRYILNADVQFGQQL